MKGFDYRPMLFSGGVQMKIEYDYTFDLPRTIVWKYIKTEKVLRNSIPNCKSFKEHSTGIYIAEMEVKLGPLQDTFAIEVQRQKEKSPSYYRLLVKGKGKLGEVEGVADLFFHPIDGGTKVKFTGDAQFSGALAVVGQRAITGSVDYSFGQFFKTVEKEIKRSLYHKQRGK